MSLGTDAFCKPLMPTSISLKNGNVYSFSARILENDLWQPVITHIDFIAPRGAIPANQEGLMMIEVHTIDDDPKKVAHALFSKYGPTLLLIEIFTNIDDGRLEIERVIWSSAQRLTALELTIPDDLDTVRDALLPSIQDTSKITGIAEILIREHFDRKKAKVVN